MGQGAGAAAAAGANRGDRDAGGTGTGTPLFKSLFPLSDPAPAPTGIPGWGRTWGARDRRGARPRRVQQTGLLPWRLRPRGMGG